MNYKSIHTTLFPTALAVSLSLLAPSAALADDDEKTEPAKLEIDASYKSDIFGVASGGLARGARYLDNLNLTATADLEEIAGWDGASAFVNVLNNFGLRPNDLAGSMQGIDNIEVSDARLKIYEAWIEQAFGKGNVTLRAGLYDLNSEFYQNDSSALLISPPFGIGSELSATGPNGPSIFPSTALAARLSVTFGNTYIKGAVVNAKAGTIGDKQGVAIFGPDGVLMIGELGWTGRGKVSLGLWRYSKEQPAVDAPALRPDGTTDASRGAYITIEQPLISKDGGISTSAFFRGGISDGRTSPFAGGWQLGVLLDHVFPKRPNSSFSIGVGKAILSEAYRASNPPGLPALLNSETIIEATYKDEILPGLSLQPDIQYVVNPAADPTVKDALVLGLRIQFDLKLK